MRVLEPMTVAIVGLVAAGYVVVVGAMFAFQRSMLYLPSTTTPLPATSGVPEMRPVGLVTADGLDLVAWYRPAAEGHPTIVYFHGNGGHIGHRGSKVRPYLDAGYGLLLVSYRGYGGNPGRPSEEGLYRDGRAALAFLGTHGVPPARTVLYGESLGTGVAVHIAAERARAMQPVGALVLEA
ncbi:MAG: alpha/beta hydrolase, partial [Rhodospirillales bacterium]